ncbi:hypothetical protein DJ568_02795 [Mucilaginibacter hurinus]|uniref:Uncharacterized protein n=1 Tax=Mucilaginibacter hurinus TaxID=2201324 RepID=A0A367GVH6_9SPHI|nr:hypothetical protein [Mucilaginibacter hurinus]RCH56801.1 hypothetical protein DJ568_02795 [Mucilaginibacter hurinus]
MNNLKNPILNFRRASDTIIDQEPLSYDMIQGEHIAMPNDPGTKFNFYNTRTLVTLTREATDSTESSGQ